MRGVFAPAAGCVFRVFKTWRFVPKLPKADKKRLENAALLSVFITLKTKNRGFLTALTVSKYRNALILTIHVHCKQPGYRRPCRPLPRPAVVRRKAENSLHESCHKKEGHFAVQKRKCPRIVLHAAAVPTEQSILSAFTASILAWLPPPSRLPGKATGCPDPLNLSSSERRSCIFSSDPCG